MTFEQRCNRFKEKIKKETNLFKKVDMIYFLNKEIEKNKLKKGDDINERNRENIKWKKNRKWG